MYSNRLLRLVVVVASVVGVVILVATIRTIVKHKTKIAKMPAENKFFPEGNKIIAKNNADTVRGKSNRVGSQQRGGFFLRVKSNRVASCREGIVIQLVKTDAANTFCKRRRPKKRPKAASETQKIMQIPFGEKVTELHFEGMDRDSNLKKKGSDTIRGKL